MALEYKFYCLEEPPCQSPRLGWDRFACRKSAKLVCPIDPAHKGSGKRLGDLQLIIPNTCLRDFVWTWYSECLIQESVLDQFRLKGFTGFLPRPVHLRWETPSDQVFPKLWEIQVTGWGGMASALSGVKRIDRCGVCGRQTYTAFKNPALLVERGQWDGSDFFMVWPMPRYIFISERVASFIKDQKMTGLEIIELDQMRVPRGFSPGGLRNWLSDDFARKLGEPLDIY